MSPTLHDRRGSFAHELVIQQMKGSNSPALPQANRFEMKDSLYLDLGKPEISGKVDTLTNGSANNSLLLQRQESMNNSSPKSASPYHRGSIFQSSNFRIQANAVNNNNPSVLKQTIIRNMQKGEEEDEQNDNQIDQQQQQHQQGKHERRHSAFASSKFSAMRRGSTNQYEDQPTEDLAEVSQENPQIHRNIERMKSGTQLKHPSKLVESSKDSVSTHKSELK